MKEKNQEQMKEKYMELKLIEKHMQETNKQLKVLQEQLADLVTIQESISDLKTVGEGREVLVPISNGIFLKTVMKETDSLIINVGSNVAVVKNIPQVSTMLQNQSGEILKIQEQLNGQLAQLTGRASEVESEMQRLMA